ncbi:MAG: glycosyltransferase family 4 protein [Terrimicrobiaceae bacterium]
MRAFLRQILDLPRRARHRRTIASIERSDNPQPVLSFGGVLDHGGLIHGGAVKLLHLREAFAGSEERFNLLYLVSSSQPDFANDLVRLCRTRGIRFVWNQNGVGYPAWAGREAERHNAPMRKLRAQADYIIYQSEFCRTSAEKFLGPEAGAGEVLFNPVDLQKFHPPAQPPPLPLRLLALGTQNYAGRVLSPIDCVKTLRAGGIECTLTIAGRLLWNNAEAGILRYIESLGLSDQVRLRPAFTQDEAAELYRTHHILLHPKYLDPCPTVVIEALASGLPVVGSGSGGLPEMVPADCGELIPAPVSWTNLITPRPDELASAVTKILPHLSDYSRAARRHAEKSFDGAQWVARHREIFHKLLS